MLVKTTVSPLSGRVNINIHGDRSCSLKNDAEKLSFIFQRDIQQAKIDSNFVGLSKSPLSNRLSGEEEEQSDSPNFWKERDQIIKKRAYAYFSIVI